MLHLFHHLYTYPFSPMLQLSIPFNTLTSLILITQPYPHSLHIFLSPLLWALPNNDPNSHNSKIEFRTLVFLSLRKENNSQSWTYNVFPFSVPNFSLYTTLPLSSQHFIEYFRSSQNLSLSSLFFLSMEYIHLLHSNILPLSSITQT